MTDDKFAADLKRTEAQGKTRYGDDNWQTAIDAISKTLAGGIPESNMRAVLAEADPARTIYDFAKECLLQRSDNGDHDAERAYRAIRHAEREAYRRNRGR
jgi:hypothetical protein